MNRALRERTERHHETAIHTVPAGPDTPAVYQAYCSCGWHWASRFYFNRADADAANHMAAVEMFRTANARRTP